VKRKAPASIAKTHLTAPPEILRIVHDILNNTFTGVSRQIYLDSKVFDILLSCLLHATDVNNPFDNPLTKADIRKIRQARDLILNGLQYNQSVSLLADKISMSQRKLTNGFKMIYGKTIYNFLIDERLKKAMALIRDTNTPLHKIAVVVGYKRPTNFSDAFKKKFGYAPSELRKTTDERQPGNEKKNEGE
jgi:AraC-like DNA-binding protein